MDWLARHKKPLLWSLVVLLAPGVALAIGYRSVRVWQMLDEPLLPMIGIIALRCRGRLTFPTVYWNSSPTFDADATDWIDAAAFDMRA